MQKRPVFDGLCIKKCGKEAGATPWLCFPCFRVLTFEWAKWHYGDDGLYFETKLKRFRNRTQKNSRKAFKKHLNSRAPG